MNDSEKIFNLIEKSSNVLLLCHRQPDADTLGSAGAMAFYISSLNNKKASIHLPENGPMTMRFLQLEQFIVNNSTFDIRDYDLIIAVDCGDASRTGLSDELLSIAGEIPTVNIDHHQTNPNYAEINIVRQASSTAEIIFDLLDKQNIIFTPEICTCLLAGIITDTDYFTNAGTSKESMAIASELIRRRGNINRVIQGTWKNNSPEALRLWGKILSRLHFNEKHKIVTAVITEEDAGLPEVYEGLANFLTMLYEANIIVVLREDSELGIIKGSLRTTKDHIDVAKLAQKFGGGGHAKAAGFAVPGKLVQTEKGWQISLNK